MVNMDALQQFALDHQQALLDEAARRRLLNNLRTPRPKSASVTLRNRLALALRRLADWLEPIPSGPRVGVLRAVAHREISVDQGLTLLERNGHRSMLR